MVEHIIVAYNLVVLFAAIVLAAIAACNLITFRGPRAPVVADDMLPFVSVLVPARNEEAHIAACVESLLAQNYPLFEVLVLDDQSGDATYEILNRIRNRDERLRVLVGAELPHGWCGKPHACWQLANAARGSYLLFTDADCRFGPDALLMAVGGALEHNADLVSLMPEYVNVSFWERSIVPLLVMIPFCFLPLPLVRGSRFPLLAGANGSFLFMRRETYMDIDGHRAVRGELAEDVKFAQHVKRCGRTEWYGDGAAIYRVRMYECFDDIWRGFTRNLFPAFSRKAWLLWTVIVGIAATMILPPLLAAAGWALSAPWTTYAFTAYILMVAVRILIRLRLKQDSPLHALLNPLSWLMAVAIAIASIHYSATGRTEWKGRLYRAEPEPSPRRAEPEPSPRRAEPEPSPRRAEPEPSPRRAEPEPSPRRAEPEPSPRRAEPGPVPRGRDGGV